MKNNKSAAIVFTKLPMITFSYDYTISDTHRFMLNRQYMIVILSPREHVIREMICSLKPDGLLFSINIIISNIIVLLDFMRSCHS